MGILKKTVRKVSMKLAQGKKMQEIASIIMSRSEYRDGKLYSPSGKCIGWYNPETGVGWCNIKNYKELLQYQPQNLNDDYSQYDEVDLSEYFDTDYEEE